MVPELDAIDAVLARVRQVAAHALPPSRAGDVEIALAELLANTVRYAVAESGVAPSIQIEIAQGEDALRIAVTDRGEAQPSDLYDNVPDLQDIDPLAESGRGVPLILAMADRVRATPRPGANRTELSFLRKVTR